MSDQFLDLVIETGRNPATTYQDICTLQRNMVELTRDHFGLAWPRSTWGPFVGMLDGIYHHTEYQACARLRALMVNRITVWSLLYIFGVKKRPGYNDFLIVRWAFSGDEATALELIERSKRADSIGCTLCWALRSLCQQYGIFAARFGGMIPKANPADMLKDAPPDADPAAVLRRAEWLDNLRAE